MRLGCCGSFEDVPTLKAAGFDFVEVNVQSILRGEETDDVWDASAPDPSQITLPVEVANCLVPGTMPLVGPARDMAALQTYMDRVTRRAKRLGIGMLIFGSGAARHRPDDVTEAQAMDQIVEFTRMAGETCAVRDIMLLVEHLCSEECNTINSLAELKALIERTDHTHAAALLDSYHYGMERQHTQDILDMSGQIRHVHVAEPVDRYQPGVHGSPAVSKDAFDFVDFFRTLHKIGYDGRISIESHWRGDLVDAAPVCLDMLRSAWQQAGTG